MIVLGIESSCDETSIAILADNPLKILYNATFSQVELHAKFGGVVPEIASRNHLLKIAPLYSEAMATAGLTANDLDLIAVTFAPGLVGALIVGVSFARGLAFAARKPLMPVNHLCGHILSAEIEHSELRPPYLALVISGGHTHIFDVDEYLIFKLLGYTVDDACGEAFDKASKMLGGGYPGGPYIDELAKTGDPSAISFPIALKGSSNFSFSGLKTSVASKIAKGTFSANDIAASFQETVAKTLLEKTLTFAGKLGREKLVVCGGVACNSRIRELFAHEYTLYGHKVYIPSIELCSDNALMIAYAAMRYANTYGIPEAGDYGGKVGSTDNEIFKII